MRSIAVLCFSDIPCFYQGWCALSLHHAIASLSHFVSMDAFLSLLKQEKHTYLKNWTNLWWGSWSWIIKSSHSVALLKCRWSFIHNVHHSISVIPSPLVSSIISRVKVIISIEICFCIPITFKWIITCLKNLNFENPSWNY